MKKLRCQECEEEVEYDKSKFYCLCGGSYDLVQGGDGFKPTPENLSVGDFYIEEDRGGYETIIYVYSKSHSGAFLLINNGDEFNEAKHSPNIMNLIASNENLEHRRATEEDLERFSDFVDYAKSYDNE